MMEKKAKLNSKSNKFNRKQRDSIRTAIDLLLYMFKLIILTVKQ